MKKIALALIALVAVLSPLAAGESWIGVTTGPAFEINNSDDYKKLPGFDSSVTDYDWDVNVEGAYYFNEAQTIGIGAKLGFGFNYGTSVDENVLKMYEDKNPIAGFRIAPAVTFQYRLGLTDSLDLRMGAGLQYTYIVGNKVTMSMIHPSGRVIKTNIESSTHNLEVVANTDLVYSIGSFQIFGGVDFGFTVMNHLTTKTGDETDSKFIEGFAMSITPRVGVSYAF